MIVNAACVVLLKTTDSKQTIQKKTERRRIIEDEKEMKNTSFCVYKYLMVKIKSYIGLAMASLHHY